jgi:hypothetical protein
MEILIVILVVATLAGAVAWNRRTSAKAMDGVEFTVDAPPAAVLRALSAGYCSGAMAAAKSTLSGITVTAAGGSTFRVDSRLGDVAGIHVVSTGPTRSAVRVRTDQLYVGSHPAGHFRGGLSGTGARITHALFTMLGISPGAARMVRFQRGVERRLIKHIQRSPHG